MAGCQLWITLSHGRLGRGPSTMDDLNVVIDHRPPTASNQEPPSVVYRPWTAVTHKVSAVVHQPISCWLLIWLAAGLTGLLVSPPVAVQVAF